MFFRIWFLYVCKFSLYACGLMFLTALMPWNPLKVAILDGSKHVLLPIALAGAVVAFPLIVLRRKIACPVCNHPSELILCGRFQPGVECPECGLVYAKNLATSMKLVVEPYDDDAPDESGPPGN